MDRHPGRSVLTKARDRRVMRLALMYLANCPNRRMEPDKYALPILHSAGARSGLERGMQPEIQPEEKMKLLRKNVLMAVGALSISASLAGVATAARYSPTLCRHGCLECCRLPQYRMAHRKGSEMAR